MQGGFHEMSQEWIEQQCALAIFNTMTVADLEIQAPFSLASVRQQVMEGGKGATALSARLRNTGIFDDAMMSVNQGFYEKVVKKWPASSIDEFAERLSKTLQMAGPVQVYAPLPFLVKGTLLSAETILTGSVWPAIFTGAALTIIEELEAKVSKPCRILASAF